MSSLTPNPVVPHDDKHPPAGALPELPGSAAAPAFRIGPRAVLCALWLFAILNYIYCDVMASHDPQYLKELLSGETSASGFTMSEGFLLGASVLMTIPMASVLIARIAPYRVARIESIVAGAVMTLVQGGSLFVGSGPTLYYLYFSVIEVATTVAIVWIAAGRWKVDA